MTIFDHIANLTHKKKMCSDDDLKTFDVFMINKWLSMEPSLTELINELQIMCNSNLSQKQMYRIYYTYLPKNKFYLKYIKASKVKKHNPELINIITKYFKVNKIIAKEYLRILYMENDLTEIKYILNLYGIVEKKDINKLTKLNAK